MRAFLLFSLALALLGGRGFGQAVLRTGDVFEMRLSGMPLEVAGDFAIQYTVAEDGTVNVPLLGALKAAGNTTTQFSRIVERKFVAEKIFTNPTVTISLQPQSRFVTVGGGVRAPQAVPWSPDLSLSMAIKRAGGFSDFSNLGK